MSQPPGGPPPPALGHLVGLGQMGGIERCYSEFVSHPAARAAARHQTWLTSADVAAGLRERLAAADSPVSRARHLAGLRIPRRAGPLQRRRLARIAARSGADAIVLWSNPGWLDFVPDGLPVIYYEHGAAWFESVFARVQARLDRPAGFVANSFAAKRMLELRWDVAPERIHVCLNAVRGDCIPPALPERPAPTPDRVRLGAVGRLVSLKGFAVAIHAVAQLRGRGIDARLDFAGDGPDGDRLRALAQRLGVAGHVHFRGVVEDMGAFYGEIDLLVTPSLRESFGLINAEAMAQGVPVVTAAVDGIPEVVADGETGVCIAPSVDVDGYVELGGSPEELPPLCYDPVGDRLRPPLALDPEDVAEAVAALLAEPDRLAGMGRAGRRRVEECFAEDRHAAELGALLVTLAGRDQPA